MLDQHLSIYTFCCCLQWLLFVQALLVVAASSDSCHFPAIFNFGDSNSDTGGLSAAFGAAPPPHGESFFGKPAGRYCDGRLLIDFIASSLGLPFLSAYLNSIGTNFSQGANFATAGSTIRQPYATLTQSGFSPISMDVQTWEFSQFKSRSQALIQQGLFKDQLPKEEYFSQALYTIDIGQNDLTEGYFRNWTTDEVKSAIPDILDKFVLAIQSIYWEGGRYFWIHNTGPFGCLPYVLDRLTLKAPEVDRFGCGAPFNHVAQLFNQKLNQTLSQLRKDLPLGVFTYVDIYSVKRELLSYAHQHGICCFQWLLLAQAALTVAASSDSCHFPAVFNFGDSNSDTGGLSTAFGAARHPTTSPSFGKLVGRNCDGHLLVDFIASSLDLPFLSTYLNSIGTNFSHGANFATAGSTIRQPYATLTQSGFSPISMDVQT
ncbi:hypothetical protein ZIOFF_001457 [Zingiber officinale]|uniref:Alpha-L-fucosidase n=1 Tax=Zingiber officinale TaxID=94328 RepID=A0A8J5LV15_ZINOF|nr:hypothetical protein ZIOFF_001457 [Zingiber officinale]